MLSGNRIQHNRPVVGRIDEAGRVLLPVSVIASDGFELELEALINLEFAGALVLPESLAASIGWRCLGARRVIVGVESRLVRHFIGPVSLGGEPTTIVALGGVREQPIIGQKLLSGRRLTVDFASGQVVLE
ncbi:MAG TPA: hypothetical protein V6C69_20235 [Trichormus sp.]